MKHTKNYRLIVLAVCLFALALSMLACGGGGGGCSTRYLYDGSGNLVCQDSITDNVHEVVQEVNSNLSNNGSAWVNQHSSGEWKRQCMSIWSETCEQAGAYSK